MKKIAVSDLISLAAYQAQRAVIRQAIMEHKKKRRVHLGPNATLHFEDYMTMRYQILETMRAEKITSSEELTEELEVYNPLIPDGNNLKATLMLEYPDEGERRQRLAQLLGVEESISIVIEGFEPVYPIANEDLARSTEEKTSSVHFLRFEFSTDMIAAAKTGAGWSIHCEHKNYQHSVAQLAEPVQQSLTNDFA